MRAVKDYIIMIMMRPHLDGILHRYILPELNSGIDQLEMAEFITVRNRNIKKNQNESPEVTAYDHSGIYVPQVSKSRHDS